MKSLLLCCVLGLTVSAFSQAPAGEEALADVLVTGQDWQPVGETFGFTDAACADGHGNFYFSDLRNKMLYRVSHEGKVVGFLTNGPSISGMKFGPDGRLYAATQGPKKQIIAIAEETKEISVLAEDVQPNDLVVSRQGFVYFTDTGKGRVMMVDPQKKLSVAAEGIIAPNGITLSPDQRTLAVSEYRGTNVWTFRVAADGSLSEGARTMTLQVPTGRADSGGDGSTTDTEGRYYVTSHVGIQVFDSNGRLAGVIPKPTSKACVSVGFAGPKHEYLYACASDKVYRRRTQAQGALFFKAPARP